MGDLHESMCRELKARFQRKGFKEATSPMPTYRPDYFGKKNNQTSGVEHQVVVEVEILSTVFCKHTEKQILLMNEFLQLSRRKKIKSEGLLALPSNTKAKLHASLLLDSLFPEGHTIELLEV
jgi:hypothetical protein